MGAKAPKTVNNVLTVLSVMLKTAVEWGVIERVPCAMKLLKAPRTTASFHNLEEYERTSRLTWSCSGEKPGAGAARSWPGNGPTSISRRGSCASLSPNGGVTSRCQGRPIAVRR